jgi:hypothetical protein
MSYAPSTKLSHTNNTQRATVLTNENVMVTQGLGYGQMMKLADWIILADGAKIQEEYIPLPSTEIISAAPAVIGAKFRWTLNPETYRVAIMTSKGLLQVKSVTDGAGEVHPTTCTCPPCRELAMTPPAPWARRPLNKTMFADEAAWRASLPDGGTVELSLPNKIAEAQRSDEVFPRLSDLEKVKALLNRYKIRTQAWDSGSQADVKNISYDRIQKTREALAAITPQEDIDQPQYRRQLNLQLSHSVSCYNRSKLFCDKYPVLAAQRPVHIHRRGTGQLRAMIGGESMILTVFKTRIAATVPITGSAVKLYKNFAEMGNPKLSVYYRRRSINI